MKNDFLPHFRQLMSQLKAELEAFPDDHSIWQTAGGISNSAGTLTCHLCGNLQHFVGKGMGQTGYVRDREQEFSIRDVPKKKLIGQVEDTTGMLEKVIPGVDLDADYPEEYWGQPMKTSDALMKLLWHLAYHLGQVNYHRRILTL